MRVEITDYDNKESYIIESENDLFGWSIILLEPFKEGIVKVHITKPMGTTSDTPAKMMIAFCDVTILQKYLKRDIEKLQRLNEIIK